MSNWLETDSVGEDDDDGPLIRRRKPIGDAMDITPMIDITFLLLIFFIVCSTMDPTNTKRIPEAENGLAVPAKQSAVIFVNPVGRDGVVVSRFDGTEFTRDPDALPSEIVDYVASELESLDGKRHVMLFGDADVNVGQITRIQRIIGDAFEDVTSTHIAVREDR